MARAQSAQVAEESFVLNALTIDGVTAYPLGDLAPLYSDYLAREITTSDLVKIATAITDKYRADGYFLSRAVVPPQAGAAGGARIRVYEGYVAEIDDKSSRPGIVAALGDLATQRPLRLADLDRRLALLNDLPGVRVRATIEPVLEDPARHRLVVVSDVQRLTGSFYADNRGTRSVGPWQAYGRVGHNSIFRLGDQLALGILTTPFDPKEFIQAELSYGASFGDGSRVSGAASVSRSRAGSRALNNETGNNSHSFSLRYAKPLIRRRNRGLWGRLALDSRHVEQDWTNGAGYTDDLRVLRGSLQLDDRKDGRSSNLFVQLSQGLDILGASDEVSRNHSRFDADGQFFKINAQASHYADIGRYAGVFVSASGQWSADPLLFSEEFAPGALPFGRAYNYAEISGDSGVAGSAELRFGWDPKARPITFFQTYGFIDGARVWNKNNAFPTFRRSLASAGVGLRLNLLSRTSIRLEAARPLTLRPFETGSRRWRGFLSISAEF